MFFLFLFFCVVSLFLSTSLCVASHIHLFLFSSLETQTEQFSGNASLTRSFPSFFFVVVVLASTLTPNSPPPLTQTHAHPPSLPLLFFRARFSLQFKNMWFSFFLTWHRVFTTMRNSSFCLFLLILFFFWRNVVCICLSLLVFFFNLSSFSFFLRLLLFRLSWDMLFSTWRHSFAAHLGCAAT